MPPPMPSNQTRPRLLNLKRRECVKNYSTPSHPPKTRDYFCIGKIFTANLWWFRKGRGLSNRKQPEDRGRRE